MESGSIVIYDNSTDNGTWDIQLSSALNLFETLESPEGRIVELASPINVNSRICSEKSQLEQRKVSALLEKYLGERGSHCIHSGADISDEFLAERLAGITSDHSS